MLGNMYVRIVLLSCWYVWLELSSLRVGASACVVCLVNVLRWFRLSVAISMSLSTGLFCGACILVVIVVSVFCFNLAGRGACLSCIGVVAVHAI